MSKRKILYAIVGVGAGNTSRTTAIFEHLPLDRYEIRFVAQAKAYENLTSLFPQHTIYRLGEITYSSGGFGFFSIIKTNYLFPYKFYQNVKRCGEILDEFKPDVVIVDSDFYCFLPARKRKIPVVSVNSSMATVETFRKYRESVFEKFFSYYCIERVDCWLQETFADMVICPIVTPVEGLSDKARQVRPIVRKDFVSSESRANESAPKYDIVVMFGGSGIGAGEIDLCEFKGTALMLGQTEGLKAPANATFVEFDPKPLKYLLQGKIIVVQGGFNSVSEIVALRKPGIFVPIEGHAEQFANAKEVEELGLGICAKSSGVVDAIEKMENDYDFYLRNCREHAIACDGATNAAKLIQEFVDG